MFLLDNTRLLPGRPFAHAGISYPRNWLERSTPEDRAAIGIVEVPDPPLRDPRLEQPDGTPRPAAAIKAELIDEIRSRAKELLAETDWAVIRRIDPTGGQAIPPAILTRRTQIRDRSAALEAAVLAASTQEELRDVISSGGLTDWGDDSPA